MISIRWSKVQHINPPQDHLFYKTIEYTRSNSFYFFNAYENDTIYTDRFHGVMEAFVNIIYIIADQQTLSSTT